MRGDRRKVTVVKNKAAPQQGDGGESKRERIVSPVGSVLALAAVTVSAMC